MVMECSERSYAQYVTVMVEINVDPFIVLLVFDQRNRLLVRINRDGCAEPTHVEQQLSVEAIDEKWLKGITGLAGSVHFLTRVQLEGRSLLVYCALQAGLQLTGTHYYSLDRLLHKSPDSTVRASPFLLQVLDGIEPHLIRIPYLELSENEYIYRFRTAKERNRNIYIDRQSAALYQSELCKVIKAVKRSKEKFSGEPAVLDFGPVRYIIPSHFGFCLGVQNAIERAYETVSLNPEKRVFMLSELIHNSFVNQDLLARGLRYLQTDKGLYMCDDGSVTAQKNHPQALWNQLSEDDIVIIPAFGATNEDKVRLLRRGLNILEHDATCMLVEKVWKAARRYAQAGFTVLIHGKSEHEETKATFSNSARYGPALIIRNMEHVHLLSEVIQADGPEKQALFQASFEGLHSEGFDPARDLSKLAVVNQTTLLRNETLQIIEYVRTFSSERYGADQIAEHVWSKGGDTLCYATQVNQDALHKAIAQPIDIALIVGGKNSSNTFQLYRVCEQYFGTQAHYIQAESNILSKHRIRHYRFPDPADPAGASSEEIRPFLDSSTDPISILLTGGASCPDGIIQQIIYKINRFFPAESIRPLESILATFESDCIQSSGSSKHLPTF